MRRDAKIDRLSHVPMFSACTRKELDHVARVAEQVSYVDGEPIVTEGASGREFFVLVDGAAAVTRAGRAVTTLAAGDWFGELALLDGQQRDATVTAAGPVECIVIDVQRFEPLLTDIPRLAMRLMAGMARRLHELDARD